MLPLRILLICLMYESAQQPAPLSGNELVFEQLASLTTTDLVFENQI